MTCSVPDTTNCLTCMAGYTVTNGQCIANCQASSVCLACSSSNNAACTLCTVGYFVNSTSLSCELCTGAPQCLSCFQTNPAVCSLCQSGFYLTLEGTCSACPLFCGSCINATFCTSTFGLSGTLVTTINGTSVLIVCDQGCMTCQEVNPVSCSVCLPGYVLVIATNTIVAHCIPCGTNCRTCTATNSSECTSCFTGSFLLGNNTCVACNGCLTCPSSTLLTTCTACAANSLHRNNNSCDAIINAQEECGQLCSSCTQLANGNFECEICAPGSTMDSTGACISCPRNCAQCSLTRLGECTSCLPGYYFQADSELCMACNQTNCLCCTELGCTSCQSGYIVSPSFTCMQICVAPCASCS